MTIIVTREQLAQITGSPDRAARYTDGANVALADCGANASARRAAHFLGQVLHETAGLALMRECLSYRDPETLVRLFRVFKSVGQARIYCENPVALGNLIYANRNGNGPRESGDGFNFRGAGGLQTTGRGNFQAFADARKRPDIMSNPGLLASDPVLAMDSAAFYWSQNKINASADLGLDDHGIRAVTSHINPAMAGLVGEGSRTQWTLKAAHYLGAR